MKNKKQNTDADGFELTYKERQEYADKLLLKIREYMSESPEQANEVKSIVQEFLKSKYNYRLSRFFQILGVSSTITTLLLGSGNFVSDVIYVSGVGMPITLVSSIINHISVKAKKTSKQKFQDYISNKITKTSELNVCNMEDSKISKVLDDVIADLGEEYHFQIGL